MWIAALLFLTIGLSDLARSRDNAWGPWNLILCFAVGIAPLAVLTVTGAFPAPWFVGGAVLLLAWYFSTVRGLVPDRFAIVPVLVLGAVVGAVLAFPRLTPEVPQDLANWYTDLPYWFIAATPPDRAALLVAYSVFLISSANRIVTAVLSLAGPRVRDSSQTIRGGRIIGPIERLFIFWMAIAGQVLALAVIVAAKGILRYPEISERDRSGKGETKGVLAEYVLIGSLASWSLPFLVIPIY